MSPTLEIMCNILLVVSAVVSVVANQESWVCLKYMCILHSHRSFGISHMCHVLVLDPISYANAYSTPRDHVVLCAKHKMTIKATGLYHRKF